MGSFYSKPIHPRALLGIKLFNTQKYFEAHEELEFAWREEKGPIRELYRGILQVGVGYYHIQNRNYRGGKIMLERAQKWLKPYPKICLGVDVEKLRKDAEVIYQRLVSGGEKEISQFNTGLFEPVSLVIPDDSPAS